MDTNLFSFTHKILKIYVKKHIQTHKIFIVKRMCVKRKIKNCNKIIFIVRRMIKKVVTKALEITL